MQFGVAGNITHVIATSRLSNYDHKQYVLISHNEIATIMTLEALAERFEV